MFSEKRRMLIVLFVFVSSMLFHGCTAMNLKALSNIGSKGVERSASAYENSGKYWGTTLASRLRTPEKDNAIDNELVSALIGNDIDYFNVHSDLKEAFKSGFRVGYAGRVADLVLGPNIRKAAGEVGYRTAEGFVNVVNTFETGWRNNLNNAIRVFIVLLSEGSQADRKDFIQRFYAEYKPKWDNTAAIKATGGFTTQTSEGGATLYVDIKKTGAVLDIPSPDTLKGEIYRQAFHSMGDEWGKRFSNNLVKRTELVDLLRRVKLALDEGVDNKDGYQRNLGELEGAFVAAYGTSDAKAVFASLTKEAEYDNRPGISSVSVEDIQAEILKSDTTVPSDPPVTNGKVTAPTKKHKKQ